MNTAQTQFLCVGEGGKHGTNTQFLCGGGSMVQTQIVCVWERGDKHGTNVETSRGLNQLKKVKQ